MNTHPKLKTFAPRFLVAGLLAGLSQANAEVRIIESRATGQHFNEYADTASFLTSSIKSTAPGCTSGIGCKYGFNNAGGCTITLMPNLGTPGGLYEFDQTHPAASSTSVTIMVNVMVTGGVFTNIPGMGTATSDNVWTAAFQGTGVHANVWNDIGNIQLDPGVTAPTLYMTTTNTDFSSVTSRFVSDGYRFTYTGDPCLQGLPELYVVDGPLGAGQSNVTVPGVSAQATNVIVYANGSSIGHLDSTHGLVSGVNVVPTTALVKGSFITVSQTGTNGIESCNNSQGIAVGGGANPRIRVSVSLQTDDALAGPIGAPGNATSGSLYFLGATGSAGLGGFGTAPAGGQVVTPGTNWQTVTFVPNGDTGYYWAGPFAGGQTLTTSWAELDAIAFCIDDLSDSGPYQIYIDDIMNGSTVIQNFETVPAGTSGALFSLPGTSSTTSADLLAQAPGTITPNVSKIAQVISPTGTNSCMVNWQFNGTANANWLRLSAGGAAVGVSTFPQIDLSQPISFNLLVEPVGVSAPVPQTTVTPPTLLTAVTNSTLTLNWTGTFYLQVTTNLSPAGWHDVGVSNAPYSLTMTNGTHLFYRLSLQP